MESSTSNNNINVIKDVRKLFNDLRNNLSSKETKKVRKKLYKKELAVIFLKKKSKMALQQIDKRM